MTAVIDASRHVGNEASALFAAGVKTVFRYYTRDSDPGAGKRLHPAEAGQLKAAGLRLGAVYEGRFGDVAHYFSRDTGLKDATFARAYAEHTIGQPTASTIYFAFDTDADKSIIADKVLPYFEAVHDVMTEPNGGRLYDIGVYSCGGVCQTLLDRGLVTKTWVSMATKHYKSKEFRKSGRWTLDQQLPAVIAGIGCDPDNVNGTVEIGDFMPDLPHQILAEAMRSGKK